VGKKWCVSWVCPILKRGRKTVKINGQGFFCLRRLYDQLNGDPDRGLSSWATALPWHLQAYFPQIMLDKIP
jgi:hypothetical protein